MDKNQALTSALQVQMSLNANPVVSFIKPDNSVAVVPEQAPPVGEGFNIHLDAALTYDSLSGFLNGHLVGKRIEISEGLISKHVVVENVSVTAGTAGNLQIRLRFGGSFNGTVAFTGRPVYNAAAKAIEVAHLDYDLQTRSFLLNTAKWLFNNRLGTELRKYAFFSLASHFETATQTINTLLNKEWTKGIRAEGAVHSVELTEVNALPEYLLIRSLCTGNLVVQVQEIAL